MPAIDQPQRLNNVALMMRRAKAELVQRLLDKLAPASADAGEPPFGVEQPALAVLTMSRTEAVTEFPLRFVFFCFLFSTRLIFG